MPTDKDNEFITICPVPKCEMPIQVSEEKDGKKIISCSIHGEMAFDEHSGILGYFYTLKRRLSDMSQ